MIAKPLLRMAASWIAIAAFAACATTATPGSTTASAPAGAPTVAEAQAFVADAERQLSARSEYENHIGWVYSTYIQHDTEWLQTRADSEGTQLRVQLASRAARFQSLDLPPELRRKIDLLRLSLTLPAPQRDGAADQLAQVNNHMASIYSTSRVDIGGHQYTLDELESMMGTERNPARLQEMWTKWHDIARPMRNDYEQMVSIANEGARDLGYPNVGDYWLSNYDMPSADMEHEVERLWGQMQPFYAQLQCYVRGRLSARYGASVQPNSGLIRADLLGNMWAQEWGNIYDIVAPKGAGDLGYDIGDLLVAKGYDPVKMVKAGEGFYTSLGFEKLPGTFWSRSQITKPRDREVVCHASAWDIDNVDDLRIKMCTKVKADDFVTIHHELGHNFYQRAYNKQPYLYLNGANDGFHEAIGDFIALSVTPDYLVKIGLLDPAKVPSADKDIGLLLRQAMDKVAFLPFGLLMDKWRWGVFSGAIQPAHYNKAWTDLRLQYQGIVPPAERDEGDFDPGAKYHIPGNTPYARYFLARILQFQFYKAACDQAGWTGPLHRCSFYGDKAVGAKLDAMLKMGASKPWPDALEAFTGSREMDGSAMIAYFQPLIGWLKEQNKGQRCGW